MKVVIIGAGITGLSAAYHLTKSQYDFEISIYEKNSECGGLCRTKKINDFLFDIIGHFIADIDEYSTNLIIKLLNNQIIFFNKKCSSYYNNSYIRYPYEYNLCDLTLKDRTKNLLSLIKNRFFANSRITNFEEWMRRYHGDNITDQIHIPYNKKLLKILPKDSSCDWIKNYLSPPKIGVVLRGLSKYTRVNQTPKMFYPKEGGIQKLIDHLVLATPNVKTSSEIERISVYRKQILMSNNQSIDYDLLISTIPLTELLSKIENIPKSISDFSKSLKFVSVIVVNLGLSKIINNFDCHWIYYPERNLPFYRIGFPSSISPSLCPSGCSTIYVESSFVNNIDSAQHYQEVINKLSTIGYLDNNEIIESTVEIIKHAYVIYDKKRNLVLPLIHNYLNELDIYSIGRYGAWEYSLIPDNILASLELTNHITKKYMGDCHA